MTTILLLYDVHSLYVFFPGCGTGNYVIAVSEFVGKVTGVEVNEGMLRQAKKKTSHLTNVELVKGSILSLPFPDQQFDGVICNQVMSKPPLFVMLQKIIRRFWLP